jgi:hypothetical protein
MYMRAERLLLLAIAVAFSLAASISTVAAENDSEGRTFQRATNIRSGEAIVYVYRRRSGAGAAAAIGFDINDAFPTALWSGRYEAVAVPAGKVTVRVRGVGDVPLKCVSQEGAWTIDWFLTGKRKLSYLGVYGGPKWETTFQAEAGKEYFVEVAGGLRVNLRTEETAMQDNLSSLKRARRVNIFLTKAQAENAVRQVRQECSENRLAEAYRTATQTTGLRAAD